MMKTTVQTQKLTSPLLSIILSVFALSLLMTSCVPSRQFDEMQAKERQCRDELEKLKTENRDLTAASADLTVRNDQLSKENLGLKRDTSNLGNAMARLND